jgi:MFS family permease
MATEMAMPLLPAFLLSLNAGAAALGLVEGCADFIASLLKFFSGRLSDRTGSRRPWVLGGYLLSSLVRPMLALASAAWHVVLLRSADRTGKGLRTSARDAMLADSVSPEDRGAAFGFHQGMDHLGAVAGPLLAVALLSWVGLGIRSIFWLAAIPGALAVIAIVAGVEELKPQSDPSKPKTAPLLTKPPKALIGFLIPLAIFSLGASSDLFLLLKASSDKMPVYGLPLLWAALHVVKSSSSLPGGKLSDRIGPYACISLGWLWYALAYLGFSFSPQPGIFVAIFLAYGAYYGLSESPEKALVAKLVSSEERGSAFGWYHLTVGFLSLPASVFFGWLYDHVSPQAAFMSGAAFAGSGLLLLWVLRPRPA